MSYWKTNQICHHGSQAEASKKCSEGRTFRFQKSASVLKKHCVFLTHPIIIQNSLRHVFMWKYWETGCGAFQTITARMGHKPFAHVYEEPLCFQDSQIGCFKWKAREYLKQKRNNTPHVPSTNSRLLSNHSSRTWKTRFTILLSVPMHTSFKEGLGNLWLSGWWTEWWGVCNYLACLWSENCVDSSAYFKGDFWSFYM